MAASRSVVGRLLVASILHAVCPPHLAHAAIPDLVWEEPQVVDSGSVEVSPGSGSSVLHADGLWHVVYLKGGNVFHRARSSSGWLPAEALTQVQSLTRGPLIAQGGGYLHVVWEQPGAPIEVWTRRWDGTAWSAAECLSCDGYASWSPVIAGSGPRAMVAWSEYTVGTIVQVRARLFRNGAWDPVEDVSASTAHAEDPSVTELPGWDDFVVAWSDNRDGTPQVWAREWSSYQGWLVEKRMTEAPGGALHPSVHGETCCGDAIDRYWYFGFESYLHGSYPETFFQTRYPEYGEPQLVSADDYVFSDRPNVGGFAYVYKSEFGGSSPRLVMTWSDATPDDHFVNVLGVVGARDTLSTRGLSGSAVGATEGDPRAELMAVWVEDRDGMPELVARVGNIPGHNAGLDENGAPGSALWVVPNPCRSNAVLTLRSPVPTTARVRIVDATGRLVRDLGVSTLGGATRAIRWNTRDALGRAVPPGRYWAIARYGTTEGRRGFIVLR
jgi:hypothetical protein